MIDERKQLLDHMDKNNNTYNVMIEFNNSDSRYPTDLGFVCINGRPAFRCSVVRRKVGNQRFAFRIQTSDYPDFTFIYQNQTLKMSIIDSFPEDIILYNHIDLRDRTEQYTFASHGCTNEMIEKELEQDMRACTERYNIPT